MKKIIFFFIIGLFLLNYSVNANLLFHTKANSVTGTVLINEVGNNGTVTNALIWNAGGKLNGALYYNDLYYGNTNTFPILSNWSSAFWFKLDSITAGYVFFGRGVANGNDRVYNANGATIMRYYDSGAISYDFTVQTMATGIWYHTIVTYNGTHMRVYLNNTESSTGAVAFVANYASEALRLGAYQTSPGNMLKGYMDDIRFYNEVINTTTMDFIWDDGSGTEDNYYVTVSSPINVALISPSNLLIDNKDANFTYNYTGFSLNNCSLYDNRTGIWAINKTIINPTANTTLTTNYTGLTSGNYKWNIMCSNGTEYWASSNYSFTLDFNNPTITLNANNAFNENNLSNENQYDDNMTLNITFADSRDLYAMSINITKGNTIYFNMTNESLDGITSTYYNILNTSSWGEGIYNIEILTSDSHTDRIIGDYIITKKNKELIFNTLENNEIKIYSEEDAITNSNKQTDRYDFNFKFTDRIIKDRTFHITSDKKITYKINSKYKAHFVVWNGKDGNWIDFEGVESKPLINKINDYHYTVTFSNLNNDVIFNSIGGLNVVTKNYKWYRGKYNLFNPNNYAGEPILLSLNISVNYSIAILDADLIYDSILKGNNTKTNYTKYISFNKTFNVGDYGIINYYWNITLTQTDGTILRFNLNGQQTILQWRITNCSNADAANITLAFNIHNEENPPAFLEADFDININYWITNPENPMNFSISMNGSNNYNLCLTKPSLNIYSDVYINYKTVNGFTNRYYIINQSLTNTTLNITMYNFDTTIGISNLKGTTRVLSSYKYYPNLIVKMQRFYLGENVWRTVQMDKTDDYGQIFFNVKEETTDYRFIFYDLSNNILKNTESMKLICDAGICELTFLISPYEAISAATEFTASITFNNATGKITVVWNDALGNTQSVRIVATKYTGSGNVDLCDTIQSGAAGTYDCDISGQVGNILVRVYKTASPEIIEASKWIYSTVGKLGDILDREIGTGESVFWTLGIITTITMIGLFSAVGAVTAFSLSLIIIFFLGIFTPLTLAFLIMALIMAIIIGIKVKK